VEAKMTELGEGTTPQTAVDALIEDYEQKGEYESEAALAYRTVKGVYDVLCQNKKDHFKLRLNRVKVLMR
jgi:hypothetical protein